MRQILFPSLFAIVPFAAACDDERHPADGAPDGDVGADVEADAGEDGGGDGGDGSPGALVFEVRAGRSWSSASPMAGARTRVFIDGAGQDLVADDAGQVDLGVVDWSSVESFTVTFFPEGHPVITYSHLSDAWVRALTGADGTIHVRFDEPRPEPTVVSIGGSAVNMHDEANYLTVSATGFNDYHAGQGPRWAVDVSAGEPITLVAAEVGGGGRAGPRGVDQVFYGWVVAQHPAIAEDTTMELDMSDTVETVPVSGSFTIPERGRTDFFETARPYLEIRTNRDVHRGAFIGYVARGWVTGSNLYEYEGEYALVDGVDRPITRYLMVEGELTSNIYVGGYPGGDQQTPFLEPPVLSSTLGDLSWTIDDAALADPSVRSQFVLSTVSGSTLTPCHFVHLPKEVTTLGEGEMPRLPSGADTCGRRPFANVQLFEDGELYGEAAPVRFTASTYVSFAL